LAGAPVTIQAEKPLAAVLDGVRRAKGILCLERAGYVTIRSLEIRWYDRQGRGIYAVDSPHLTVTGCKVWNMDWSGDWGEGVGVFLHRSSDALLDHNLALRNEQGFLFVQSPRATLANNTAMANTYGAVGWSVQSAMGSKMYNNSFCFTGNDQVYFETLDQSELETFAADYNNYGCVIGPSYRQADTQELPTKPPAQSIDSKAILRINDDRYQRMDKWQKATGWDQHSIFQDPRYVDTQHHDFRLQPGSPNLGAGKDGKDIGAFGPAQ
jgi:parallel beta-helix repeat protein